MNSKCYYCTCVKANTSAFLVGDVYLCGGENGDITEPVKQGCNSRNIPAALVRVVRKWRERKSQKRETGNGGLKRNGKNGQAASW